MSFGGTKFTNSLIYSDRITILNTQTTLEVNSLRQDQKPKWTVDLQCIRTRAGPRSVLKTPVRPLGGALADARVAAATASATLAGLLRLKGKIRHISIKYLFTLK